MTDTKTPTPRTDAKWQVIRFDGDLPELLEWARTLERELAEANALVRSLRQSIARYDNKVQQLEYELGLRFMPPRKLT